jgi:GrpB-like predicted nucleotidyltransferase (UPF0157 family)
VPDQLPLQDRIALSEWTLHASDPKFELNPNSDRELESIELVGYDPAWPSLFDAWKQRLLAALPAAPRRIDHVGSTAVPAMAAKPLIDIQISFDDPENEASYVPAIESLGVQLRSRDSEHRYFRPFAGRPRDVHIHVCLAGGEWERKHLLFRDYLRASETARARYLEAKKAAAARWADDRMAYTDAKGRVIRALMAEAEAWSTGS